MADAWRGPVKFQVGAGADFAIGFDDANGRFTINGVAMLGPSMELRWNAGRLEWLFPDALWRYPVLLIVDGEPTNGWSDGTP